MRFDKGKHWYFVYLSIDWNNTPVGYFNICSCFKSKHSICLQKISSWITKKYPIFVLKMNNHNVNVNVLNICYNLYGLVLNLYLVQFVMKVSKWGKILKFLKIMHHRINSNGVSWVRICNKIHHVWNIFNLQWITRAHMCFLVKRRLSGMWSHQNVIKIDMFYNTSHLV